jgi:hypothetical protein
MAQRKDFENLRIWQCGYCGRINPGTTCKCLGCGNYPMPEIQPLSTDRPPAPRPKLRPTDEAYPFTPGPLEKLINKLRGR